jgi:hypothetical protein
MLPGTVAVYSADESGFRHSHERATRAGIAKRLAALKGFDFVGEYDLAARYPGPIYLVPSNTLVGLEAAAALGVHSEHDLFGGVVPHPFVATKAITHPLVEPEAQAPLGWSHGFGRQVSDAVLAGFTVFTLEDAYRAGGRLLACGPVRIKPVRATGGRAQIVVSDLAGLEVALGTVSLVDLSDHGLVLEEDLVEVTTYSVGQVRVAGLVVTYWGTQSLTPDNHGAEVYGGSELFVVRGGFEALPGLDPPEEAQLAVAQAQVYDAAATEQFPGFFASRRNYDVAHGLDAGGRRRSGVLEQSWRIGGASGAEVAALEAFRAEPKLQVVRAITVEVYGGTATPPPEATVYFRGVDERDGPLLKYALAEPHEHAR